MLGRVSAVDHRPCLAVLMATTFVRFEAIASDAAARCLCTLARARLVTLPIIGFLRRALGCDATFSSFARWRFSASIWAVKVRVSLAKHWANSGRRCP